MVTKGTIPSSQRPTTFPRCEPDDPSPYHLIQSISSQTNSLKSILMLSSHTRISLPNGFFPSSFINIFSPMYWYNYPKNYVWTTSHEVPHNATSSSPLLLTLSKATSCVPATSVHPHFPPSHLSGQTHVCKWGCPTWKRVASERAKRRLWLAAATKLVCPLLHGRSSWGAAIRSHAEISGKKNAITDTLQVVDKQVTRSVELGRAKSWQGEAIAL